MGITYQVTDVEGPVAAVSSTNDGGKTVVLSPQGSWKHRDETWESNVLDGSPESWHWWSAARDGGEERTTR